MQEVAPCHGRLLLTSEREREREREREGERESESESEREGERERERERTCDAIDSSSNKCARSFVKDYKNNRRNMRNHGSSISRKNCRKTTTHGWRRGQNTSQLQVPEPPG